MMKNSKGELVIAKLIIEIDGSQHCEDNALNYDEKRTKFFKDLGLNIVRFFNNDLDNNFEGVCIMIENEVKKLIRR